MRQLLQSLGLGLLASCHGRELTFLARSCRNFAHLAGPTTTVSLALACSAAQIQRADRTLCPQTPFDHTQRAAAPCELMHPFGNVFWFPDFPPPPSIPRCPRSCYCIHTQVSVVIVVKPRFFELRSPWLNSLANQGRPASFRLSPSLPKPRQCLVLELARACIPDRLFARELKTLPYACASPPTSVRGQQRFVGRVGTRRSQVRQPVSEESGL